MLLRLRAKTVRAGYKRHWERRKNIKPRKCKWESPEDDGDASDRQDKLLDYFEQHLPSIERYAYQIRLKESASARLRRANRIGGDRHHTWCDINIAIDIELSRRERSFFHSAQSATTTSAQAQNTYYPLQFSADVSRIERELIAEYLGVHKPTFKDNLKAALVNAYETHDVAETKRRYDQIERKLALQLVRRRAKKARERRIRLVHNFFNSSDPN